MRVALVGCGKMGEAILSGWLKASSGAAQALGPQDILVVEPTESRRKALEETYGVRTFPSSSDLPPHQLLVLAVKPQVMRAVMEDLSQSASFAFEDAMANPLVVSIAAGISTDAIRGSFSHPVRVVRVMPNLPLQIAQGAAVVSGGASATEEDVRLVCSLFEALGLAAVVPEGHIDAVCAISGGGPAYVAHMIEALRDAGVESGLDGDLAEKLACQTILGTAQVLAEGEMTPEELRRAVCSPGGTTLAALAAMDDDGFMAMFANGVQAAIKRSKELSQC